MSNFLLDDLVGYTRNTPHLLPALEEGGVTRMRDERQAVEMLKSMQKNKGGDAG